MFFYGGLKWRSAFLPESLTVSLSYERKRMQTWIGKHVRNQQPINQALIDRNL